VKRESGDKSEKSEVEKKIIARRRKDAKKAEKYNMDENQISKVIVDCCYKIHTRLGPGLLESVYLEILIYELKKLGLKCEKEVGIPVHYEDIKLDLGFRADVIVENLVIIELKAVEKIMPVHKKQLMTYLRLTRMKLGLLVNFNVNLIKDGIERVVHGL
jgi:GxxExxY protein